MLSFRLFFILFHEAYQKLAEKYYVQNIAMPSLHIDATQLDLTEKYCMKN